MNIKQFRRPPTSKEHCRFCEFLTTDASQSRLNTPWLQCDEYAALVSLGALVPGWSLVCPRTHQVNMAQQFQNDDFWDFMHDVQLHLSQSYSDPIRFFEHGPLVEGSATGCGTDHAHLHAVPLGFSLVNETLAYSSELEWCGCLVTDIADIAAGNEYLFMADELNGPDTHGYIAVLDESTSQFFRKMIANRLGLSTHFDYRHFPMKDIVEESCRKLASTTHHIAKTWKVSSSM